MKNIPLAYSFFLRYEVNGIFLRQKQKIRKWLKKSPNEQF